MKRYLVVLLGLITCFCSSPAPQPDTPDLPEPPKIENVGAGEHDPCNGTCLAPGRIDRTSHTDEEVQQWWEASYWLFEATGIMWTPVVVEACAEEEDCIWGVPEGGVATEDSPGRIGYFRPDKRQIVIDREFSDDRELQVVVKLHELLHGYMVLHTTAPTVMSRGISRATMCVSGPEFFQLCELQGLCQWQRPDCEVEPGWKLYVPTWDDEGNRSHVEMSPEEFLELIKALSTPLEE